jgi:photosystem II stability/assembly factor-like uncharacterized protein
MRFFTVTMLCLLSTALYAQKAVNTAKNSTAADNPENIYSIKQHFLYEVLHNPTDKGDDEDNELTRFNRWFNDMEPRCYPTGDIPKPDMLLRERLRSHAMPGRANKQTAAGAWQPVGPKMVPSNFNGIGRVNCIVIDPKDTATLYVGTACGGVWISHDAGATWASGSDNFPSLSVADIVVNPKHTDTIYAATGDGYGYENGTENIFWGGLYTAGIMRSADGGKTWDTTGLSFIQSDRDIIQKLLINPDSPSILLAATRSGILRSADGGATWKTVDAGHVYSMAFRPQSSNIVYAVNNTDLRISYNSGATWSTRYSGINPTGDRCTIAVSPATPNSVWVLDAHDNLQCSHTGGNTFFTTLTPDSVARFYGYYDRVLGVSPTDSNYILAFGMIMAKSVSAGFAWNKVDLISKVHVDNHAVAINPLHSATIYTGNDGGISVSYDGGLHWTNLGNGLMISQIYRIGVSQQNPYTMVCGLQDNGSFTYDGTNWHEASGGDGEACAVHPQYDQLQISSSQYGYFNISFDGGANFAHINVCSESGSWTTPVVFDPNNTQNMYFGYKNIYASFDGAASFSQLTTSALFSGGAISMAIGYSNSKVLYAADYTNIYRSMDGGVTWKTVTGNLPSGTVAIKYIAVDYSDPMRVFVTTSGYTAGDKVFSSTTGGVTWSNISGNLPNLPANCIAIDSSTPGALFVGTDMGVYYTDASQTGWTLYSTGLPNVIVNDLSINYANYKVRAATYGRGVWENGLKKDPPPPITGIAQVKSAQAISLQVYPNPTTKSWKLLFPKQKPGNFSVKVTDVNGSIVYQNNNTDIIDAARLSSGVYTVEVTSAGARYSVKAVKE